MWGGRASCCRVGGGRCGAPSVGRARATREASLQVGDHVRLTYSYRVGTSMRLTYTRECRCVTHTRGARARPTGRYEYVPDVYTRYIATPMPIVYTYTSSHLPTRNHTRLHRLTVRGREVEKERLRFLYIHIHIHSCVHSCTRSFMCIRTSRQYLGMFYMSCRHTQEDMSRQCLGHPRASRRRLGTLARNNQLFNPACRLDVEC